MIIAKSYDQLRSQTDRVDTGAISESLKENFPIKRNSENKLLITWVINRNKLENLEKVLFFSSSSTRARSAQHADFVFFHSLPRSSTHRPFSLTL
jgi:hypothetical protein